jgi:hypothetical protein
VYETGTNEIKMKQIANYCAFDGKIYFIRDWPSLLKLFFAFLS